MLSASPPPGHLPAETLAAYIDGSLPPSARAEVEAHVADCFPCRSEFVSAKRLVNAAPAPTPAARSWPSVAVVGAAAAAILLMVISRQAPTASSPRMRSVPIPSAANSTTLAVVMPAREAVVTPTATGVRFVWRASESVVEYTLTVLDADGRARWTTSTSDTSVALPDSVVLARGVEIHWYVDGLKSDGRSVGTGRQRFTTR
jgi:anti-sigma factor RsiW